MSGEIRGPSGSTPGSSDDVSREPEPSTLIEPFQAMADEYRAALESWGVTELDVEEIIRRAMKGRLADWDSEDTVRRIREGIASLSPAGADPAARKFPPDPAAAKIEGELHTLHFVIHMNGDAIDLLSYSTALFSMEFKADAGWFWDAVLNVLGVISNWDSPGIFFDLMFSAMSGELEAIRAACDASGNNQVRLEGVLPVPSVVPHPDPDYVFGQQHHDGGGINWPPGQAIVARSYNPATRQWTMATNPGKAA